MSVDKLVDSTQLDSDLTSVANAIRTKSGGSAQLAFPAGFVSEIGNIPSGGGGGPTVIASGTAQGSGTHNMEIPIGTKAPIRNFVVVLWADDGTTFVYDSAKRQFFGAEVLIDGTVGYMAFKQHETSPIVRDMYEAVPAKTYSVNNSGSISTADYNPMCGWVFGVYGSNKYGEALYSFLMYKYADKWTVFLNRSNPAFVFPSTVNYNFKVIYYGTDPSTDIVEVS